MATTTAAPASVQMIALQEIGIDRNARQELADDDVDALAQSIKLLGQLTPVSLRPARTAAMSVISSGRLSEAKRLVSGFLPQSGAL